MITYSYVSLFLEIRYSVVIVDFRGMIFDPFKDFFTEEYAAVVPKFTFLHNFSFVIYDRFFREL